MSLKHRFLNHLREHAIIYQLAVILGVMTALIGGFFLTIKFLQRSGDRGYVATETLSDEEILAYTTRPEDQVYDKPIDGKRLGLQEVIRRALKAHGGVKNLAGIRTLRRSGTIETYQNDPVETIEASLIYRAPDHIRYSYDTSDYIMTAGSNGEDFWQRIQLPRGEVSYKRMSVSDQTLVKIDLMTVLPFSDALWRKGEMALWPTPDEAPDAPYLLERRIDGFIDRITIDPNHFLCLKREITAINTEDEGLQKVTLVYADYRYVEEVALPFEITTLIDDVKSNSIRLDVQELNSGILSYVFDPPDEFSGK